jgi:hypothetical protein
MGTNSYNYAYDPIGNRLTAAVNAATNVYASNPLNQYTNISGGAASSPTYDADGNMLTCALLTGEWYFFWDGENRLVCASNAETLVRNTYDHQSRRIRKEVFAFSQATANFEPVTYNSFLWDNWNVIREIATAYGNSVTNYYTWGLDLSGTLQKVGFPDKREIFRVQPKRGVWLYAVDSAHGLHYQMFDTRSRPAKKIGGWRVHNLDTHDDRELTGERITGKVLMNSKRDKIVATVGY